MPDESININESVQVVENAKNVNEKTPARRSDARRKLVDLSTNMIEENNEFYRTKPTTSDELPDFGDLDAMQLGLVKIRPPISSVVIKSTNKLPLISSNSSINTQKLRNIDIRSEDDDNILIKSIEKQTNDRMSNSNIGSVATKKDKLKQQYDHIQVLN